MLSIDVAVPCYQYGRFLRDCVTSITSQDVANLRVLIIDNGSTDDSLEVAQELARSDGRITVAHHPRNLGQKRAYNEAIDWASATYFAILDADDVMAPGALYRAMSIMESDPSIAFCHGAEPDISFAAGCLPTMSVADATHRWTVEAGSDFIERLCLRPINPLGAATVVVRTSVQKAAGHYHPAVEYADDLEMWLRLACYGKVAGTPTVQAVRRVHSNQLTREFDGRIAEECVEILGAFESFFSGAGRTLPGAAKLSRCVQRSLASRAYWSGLSHLARGHYKGGIALLKFVVGHRPTMAILPPLDWLLRMESPLGRVGSVLATATGARHGWGQQVSPQ